MYKLFSPKDYTFLGLVFGLPTALYASVRNGLALKDGHSAILRQTMPFVWMFVGLFLLSVLADAWAVHTVVARLREAISAAPMGYLGYGALTDSADRIVRSAGNTFSFISWAFVLAQLGVLVLFVKKTKSGELPLYESLKQSQQMTARSNVELVLFGFGVWILFWGYGQLVVKVLVMMVK
jgi:hypothetical protein